MCPVGFIGMPGPVELIIIGFIAVLLFGNRLPGVARSVGSSFVQFKKGLKEVEDATDEITEPIKETAEQAERLARKKL